MTKNFQVTEEVTRKIAHLARLELTDHEVRTFTTQIDQILKHVHQLSEVKGVDDAPIMTQALGKDAKLAAFREDEVKPRVLDENGKPKILQHAPDVLYDGFKVPQIV